jgi:hypothetical protein
MALPSRVLGAGVNSLSTVSICGDGKNDITAVGTSAGDATQLVAIYNSIDTTAPSAGVKLMKCEAGATVVVVNSGAHTLTVYPFDSDTINGTTSASIAQNHASMFFAITNSRWYSLNGERI